MRWSLTGSRGAELLGPQRDAVLLEHPAHLAQRSPGGRPVGQRRDLVQVGLLEVGDLVHQLAVAGDLRRRAARGGAHGGEVARVAAQLRRRRPRRRSRGASAGRAGPSCRSGPAAWPSRRARESALSAVAPAVEHPHHVAHAGRAARRRRSRRARASSASYAASVAHRRAARRRRRRPRAARSPRAASATEGYGDPASAELLARWSSPSSTPRRRRRGPSASSSSRRTPSRCRAAASSAEPKTCRPTRGALVDQRRVAAHLVAGAALHERLLDGAEGPRRLAGRGDAGVGGDVGHRLRERRAQRLLERLEVLAAGLPRRPSSSTTR